MDTIKQKKVHTQKKKTHQNTGQKNHKCNLFHCSIQIPEDFNEWEWFHVLRFLSDVLQWLWLTAALSESMHMKRVAEFYSILWFLL